MRAAIVVLLLATLGLGAGLLYRHNEAIKQEKQDLEVKMTLTNRLEDTQRKFEEQEQVNMLLQTNLIVQKGELNQTSNQLVKLTLDLNKTQKEAQAAAEAAKAEMAKRDQKISDLEAQNDQLDKQAIDMKVAIANLEKSIADTEKQLAASEGDREFLLKELKRLQAEKADLERQFNDLSLLRTQVAKLKDELSISRRLEWIRMGIYGQQAQKGAERLMAPNAIASAATNFNLQVELKQDGGAVVVPAKTNGTNPATPK